MVRSAIGISLLSLGGGLSGSPGPGQGTSVPPQGTTDRIVLAKYRSNILAQDRELRDQFLEFMEKELVPFIAKTRRGLGRVR